MTKKNGPSATNNELVWFITGCSISFGHELAQQMLERGYPPAEIEKQKQAAELYSVNKSVSVKQKRAS